MHSFLVDFVEPLGTLAGTDLSAAHKMRNMNFRLCDYNPVTAAPESENGCGAHTDYGTISIIFQDGTAGVELEDPAAPGGWSPVPGDAIVILTGWCAVILSGGRISAARHRVRRSPRVRRLGAETQCGSVPCTGLGNQAPAAPGCRASEVNERCGHARGNRC